MALNLRSLALALAAALPLVGCGGAAPQGPTTASGLAEIRLAYQPGPASLPVEVADRTGIFARNGLRVVRTESNDATVVTTALAQNQYEIAMTVPTTLLVAAEKGLDIQIVSGLQRSSQANPNLAWITKDPSITGLEQLKGRTVAVPALVGQVIDSFVYLLERRGVDRKDVRFVQLGFAAMADQLNAGRVDAAVLGMNLGRPLAARNGFTVHGDVIAQAVAEAGGGTAPDAITLVFAATPAYAMQHPEVIRSFRRSLVEGIAHIASNDAEARTLLQDWLKITPEVARAAVLPSWRIEIDPQELAPYVTIAKEAGTITADPNVDELVWRDPP